MENLVNVVIPPLGEAYTYRVPPELDQKIDVGCQVEVSLGRRSATGFVVERYSAQITKERFPFTLKSVPTSEEPLKAFRASQLPFFHWIADYYGDDLANVIDLAVPSSAEARINRSIELLRNPETAELRGKLEHTVVNELLQIGSPAPYIDLARKVKGLLPVLRRLEAKGILRIEEREELALAFSDEPPPSWARREVALGEAQGEAVHAILQAAANKTFTPFLLHGVTGSGKTEVYIEAIQGVLQQGRGAIVIVPEIALTPQLIDRFRARLGGEIAVLHSALGRRLRWNSWRALLEGRSHVAIGARSAIFAPVENVGLIIVDEEHDSSYKQGEGLRYNARDLALVLGKQQQCPVILGSATPSLESFQGALDKRYRYLSLPNRHAHETPVEFVLVDMNRVKPWELVSPHISPQLGSALKETVARGEQAFLLYNRRGFASFLQCEQCGEVVLCENCSVTMTVHRGENSLLCHYCGLSTVIPQYCSHCAANPGDASPEAQPKEPPILVERGAGTEKIFDEVQSLFPDVTIARLDRDTASDHDAYRKILERLRSGEIQILVGTQMIAKGHDLPNVTLVGIADCDVGLHLPDFRSGERVFQLLTQAAGRAGRSMKPGLVVLQTRVPQHPSLVKTVTKDFAGFAELELHVRKRLGYPPFTRLLRILVASQDRDLPPRILRIFRERIEQRIANEQLEVAVLGPSPTPLARIKTLWRFHLLVKGKSPAALNTLLTELSKVDLKTDKVRVVFDMDPQDLL